MHILQQHRKGKGVERPLSFFETGDSDTIYGGQSLTALVKNGVAIETPIFTNRALFGLRILFVVGDKV